jgi:hypothetical protein
MKKSTQIAFLLTVTLQVGAYGGSLHKVWDIDLRAELRSPSGRELMEPSIFALRFSLDGTRIAVGGGAYRLGQPIMSRLLLVQIGDAKDKIRHFDIADIASDSEVLGVRPPAIAWSPTGDFILAGVNLIRLQDGSRCEIPPTLAQAFLGADRIVARMLAKTGSPDLEFFDSSCKSTGAWDIGYPEWSLADVSPDRGFVAVLRTNSASQVPLGELVVLNPIARKIVRSWPSSQSGYYARFAERGRVICAGDNSEDLYEKRRVPPRCMNVDTGQEIAESPGINGGAPLFAAQDGTRVIASDYSHLWNVFYREYDTSLNRRDVWDFAKNTVVASWRPDTQFYGPIGSKSKKVPFAFAISPDGDYVAEAGNGILRLYKIEP